MHNSTNIGIILKVALKLWVGSFEPTYSYLKGFVVGLYHFYCCNECRKWNYTKYICIQTSLIHMIL